MSLLEAALSNALVATIPALLAVLSVRVWHKPALARAFWLLVFVKLITPPLAPVPCWTLPVRHDRLMVLEGEGQLGDVDAAVAEVRLAKAPAGCARNDRQPIGLTIDFGPEDRPASTSTDETAPAPAPAPAMALDASPVTRHRALAIPAIWPHPQRWIQMSIGLWLAGSISYLCLTAIQIWRFWHAFRLAHCASPSVQRRVGRLAHGSAADPGRSHAGPTGATS